jgi:hypothetical protein
VPGPIDIITNARQRIARNAAIRGFLAGVLPAIVALALALMIRPFSAMIEARYGYELTPDRSALLIDFLIFGGVASMVVGAIRAWRAWRRADDFVSAAGEVDIRVGAHEEIVTLATLADPSVDSRSREARSPLFPLLWKRATKFLEGFDPAREFPLRVGEPLKRSSIFAGLFAIVMILATLGLVRPPSPLASEAAHLRKIADDIARTASTPDDSALAEKVRDAADALDSPNLPPEQKMKKLEAVQQELGQRNQTAKQQRSGTGIGSGSGKGSSGKGTGEGKAEQMANAEGGKGAGSGQGEGGGSQGGKNQNGAGQGEGSKQGDKNKDQNGKSQNQNNIELQNELAKAEAQVETAGAQNPGSGNEPGTDKNQPGPKSGNNPNQQGPGANPNLPGNIPMQGKAGDKNEPSADNKPSSAKDMGSGMGDAPSATGVKAQRYMKPGEGGGSINIKDARYVTFKIPSAPITGANGRAVLDANRPTAATAYVNAPLAQTRDTQSPDEQQLVPPRYRDLIH